MAHRARDGDGTGAIATGEPGADQADVSRVQRKSGAHAWTEGICSGMRLFFLWVREVLEGKAQGSQRRVEREQKARKLEYFKVDEGWTEDVSC